MQRRDVNFGGEPNKEPALHLNCWWMRIRDFNFRTLGKLPPKTRKFRNNKSH